MKIHPNIYNREMEKSQVIAEQIAKTKPHVAKLYLDLAPDRIALSNE
jgi:hypothetical protein